MQPSTISSYVADKKLSPGCLIYLRNSNRVEKKVYIYTRMTDLELHLDPHGSQPVVILTTIEEVPCQRNKLTEEMEETSLRDAL